VKFPRSRAFVLLRYTLIIAMAYLLLVGVDFSPPPVGLVLLVLAALMSNVVMTYLPARITDSMAFNVGIIVGDTLWITAALHYSGLFGAEFFYLYFFVLLLAAIGENLGLIALGAVVVCTVYVFMLSAGGGSTSLWSSRLLIRIPFLFTAAAFYGYLVDRVRRERQRVREEARIYAETIVDTVPEPLVVLNADLRVVSANGSFYRTFHVSPEETENKLLCELGNRQWDIPRLQALLEEIISRDTQLQHFEVDHEFPTIGRRAMLLSGRRLRQEESGMDMILLAIGDVTEWRRAEETRRRLEKAVETMQLGVTITDPDGRIVYANPADASMHGYSVEELVGRDARMFGPSQRWKPMAKTQVKEMDSWRRKTVNNRKDGSIFPVQLMSDVVKNAAGEPIGIVTTCEDITERQQAEEDLQESNRRLEEALSELEATQQQVLEQERLRALGQMASGIAHDFNNTLSPILGFSDLLLEHFKDLGDEEVVTRYLKMINTAAQDAASVVRRLREFYRSREDDEVFRPVNLNDLVEQVISLTQPRWKDQALASGITILIETDLQHVPLVAANEAEIREVLTNLVFNAVDAMPDGGTITVRTCPDTDLIVLEMSDTGTGMTEEVRQRCLEPFFSTKGDRGTGLGLAMVYGIIQRHHGTLVIESKPGQGTNFIIRLPVHAKQEAEGRSEEAEGPSRRLRVLVVDNEPPVVEVVRAFLTGDGHTVETAMDGLEGLKKFHAGWFDVVVTDQGMPEMSGEQLAIAIRKVAPNKPVILLTGFGGIIKSSGASPAGVDLVVSKPVTLAALRQALAKVVPD
ncbi:MAG: PAS domain S-box protein, partial [Anaerolineae bacterium]